MVARFVWLGLLALTVVQGAGLLEKKPGVIVFKGGAGKTTDDVAKQIDEAVAQLKKSIEASRANANVEKKVKSVPKGLHSDYLDKSGEKFLCSPCQFLFKTLKEEVVKETKIDVATLRPKVDEICVKFSHNIQLLENVCVKLVDKALEELSIWLEDEEQQLDPKRTCIFLHMC